MTNPLEYGKCLETGEATKSLEKKNIIFKGFCCLTVSRHFPYKKGSRNRQPSPPRGGRPGCGDGNVASGSNPGKDVAKEFNSRPKPLQE